MSNDPDQTAGQTGAPAGPLLILNSAEERLQLCLAEEGRLLAHQDWVVPGQTMRHLAPALDRILAAFDLRVFDLGGIACVRGPGGFTGLRLSLATAYGLAFGAGLPMAGLDYLPLLASGPAASGPAPLLRGRLAVLTHARHGLVHVQVFSVPDGVALCAPQIMSVAQTPNALPDALPDALNLLAKAQTPLYVLGSGVRRNMPRIAKTLPHAVVLNPIWDHPRPEQLIQAAQAACFAHAPPHPPIEPLYLRGSDAEDNLEAIARKRGLDPQEARQRLIAGMREGMAGMEDTL